MPSSKRSSKSSNPPASFDKNKSTTLSIPSSEKPAKIPPSKRSNHGNLSSNTKSLSFMANSSLRSGLAGLSAHSLHKSRQFSTHSKNPFAGNLKPQRIFNVLEKDDMIIPNKSALLRKQFGDIPSLKNKETEQDENNAQDRKLQKKQDRFFGVDSQQQRKKKQGAPEKSSNDENDRLQPLRTSKKNAGKRKRGSGSDNRRQSNKRRKKSE
uniref:Uncharacterized protein n=1 Tax=Percolomonas cosmopolitus TaxID=63605 RepID=A0A7S1KPV7_9EUKA